MNDLLSQLKEFSVIVADTGDFEAIRKLKPQDATTNPSLLLKAVEKPEYAHVVERALNEAKKESPSARLESAMDRLAVAFGIEILGVVPNRVSTEVDARLSFDTEQSVTKARHLIQLYQAAGIPKERVLIKLASTWEGIQAARILKKDSINCNLTLLFSLPQAIACAEAEVQLISPFVGRILDWYKKSTGRDYAPADDPGVQSVTEIYKYYKKYGYETEIMGASFRNTGEILELAGCDLLTISPPLLEELAKTSGQVARKLDRSKVDDLKVRKTSLSEKEFRWQLNENQMATEKLSDGIRVFAADARKLEKQIEEKLK